MSLTDRLHRLERRDAHESMYSLAGRLSLSLGVRPGELLEEAHTLANRESEIGYDAMVEELAADAGVTVAELLADVAELERAA